MKIYKITEASEYLGVSINTLKTLSNNGKINSFKTIGEHRRFRQDDLDAYMGVKKEKQEKLTVIYARCSTAKQKENLERQKDKDWSIAVKNRDRYRCRFGYAGCTGEAIDACHIFSRGHKKLRWNINNGLAGCRNCHIKTGWNTNLFEEHARKLVGEEVWKELIDIMKEVYGIIK